MVKEELRKKEPIVYASLLNDLKNHHLSQCYLFSGEYNPFKKEVAYLLAQSIIEDRGDFACEECVRCQRIKNNQYYDVLYVDGNNKTIKKDAIEEIMKEFSRTALESEGKKVYIIDNINVASTKALNMLLKFMEEPSNNNTYGILITNQIDSLLDTIVSRCQNIPFLTKDYSEVIKMYMESGFSEVDAYLLSNIHHQYIDIDLNDERYLSGKELVYKTIDNLDNPEYLLVMFYLEFYNLFSNDDFRVASDYYLDIFLKIIEDAIENRRLIEEYNEYLEKIYRKNVIKLLEIMQEAKSKCAYNVDRKLLFDALASEIIKVK